MNRRIWVVGGCIFVAIFVLMISFKPTVEAKSISINAEIVGNNIINKINNLGNLSIDDMPFWLQLLLAVIGQFAIKIIYELVRELFPEFLVKIL